MPLDVVDTLRNLVRTPSVNPMGRDVSGPEFYEYQVTDHLERLFESLGLEWERQEVAPKRSNILARLDGDRPLEDGGKLLMFEAHQDTVPVDGMTIEPWCGDLKDGRIWGRGSCDIKGGMSAMIAALARLAEEKPAGRPTVVMACAVERRARLHGRHADRKQLARTGQFETAPSHARRGHRRRAHAAGRRGGSQGRRPLAVRHPRPARRTARSRSSARTRSTKWDACWRRSKPTPATLPRRSASIRWSAGRRSAWASSAAASA